MPFREVGYTARLLVVILAPRVMQLCTSAAQIRLTVGLSFSQRLVNHVVSSAQRTGLRPQVMPAAVHIRVPTAAPV